MVRPSSQLIARPPRLRNAFVYLWQVHISACLRTLLLTLLSSLPSIITSQKVEGGSINNPLIYVYVWLEYLWLIKKAYNSTCARTEGYQSSLNSYAVSWRQKLYINSYRSGFTILNTPNVIYITNDIVENDKSQSDILWWLHNIIMIIISINFISYNAYSLLWHVACLFYCLIVQGMTGPPIHGQRAGVNAGQQDC